MDLRQHWVPVDKALSLQRDVPISVARRLVNAGVVSVISKVTPSDGENGSEECDGKNKASSSGREYTSLVVARLHDTIVSKACRILVSFDTAVGTHWNAFMGGLLVPQGWQSGWPDPVYILMYKPRYVLTSREPGSAGAIKDCSNDAHMGTCEKKMYLPRRGKYYDSKKTQIEINPVVIRDAEERSSVTTHPNRDMCETLPFITDLLLNQEDGSRYSRVSPAGRLDLESEGLILMTSDSTFNTVVTSPAYAVLKTYRVLVKSKACLPVFLGSSSSVAKSSVELEEAAAHKLQCKVAVLLVAEKGADTDTSSDKKCPQKDEMLADKIDVIDVSVHKAAEALDGTAVFDDNRDKCPLHVFAVLDIDLREGKKHEVRRMLSSIGMQTLMLQRIHIANIQQEVLKPKGVHEALDRYRMRHLDIRQTAGLFRGDSEPMGPGHMRHLRSEEVDAIFRLARKTADAA